MQLIGGYVNYEDDSDNGLREDNWNMDNNYRLTNGDDHGKNDDHNNNNGDVGCGSGDAKGRWW